MPATVNERAALRTTLFKRNGPAIPLLANARTLARMLATIFGTNDNGVFYDPLDLSTMYQEAAGINLVSIPVQPIGLLLDKSKGLTLGTEKYTGQIPTIDGAAGGAVYTFTAATKTFTITTAGTVNGYPRINFNVGLETGKRYIVSGRISGDTAIVNGVRLATAGSLNALLFSRETGVFTGIQRADGPFLNILINGTLLGSITLSSISVKEISGNHAYQDTSSARPLFKTSPNRIEYDGVDDKLLTTFAAPLTNCTVVRAVPNEGTKILYNQTLPASYESTMNHSGFFAINRALSNSEKVLLLNEMDKRTGVTSGDSQVARSFANNEVGVAFNDFNDLSVLYQDAVGTIPVTAVGQPVGLLLDKSKGLALGAELFNDAAVTFNGAGGETVTRLSSGLYRFVAASNLIYLGFPSIGQEKDRYLLIDYEIVRIGSGDLRFDNGGGRQVAIPPVVGRKTMGLMATTLTIARRTNPLDCDIRIHSIREVLGNHAFQTVSASRPLLAYTPVSGVRNVATYSTNAADASWSFGGTRTSGIADSKGRLNAVRWSGVSTVPTKGCTVQKTGVHTITMRLKVESTSGSCVVLVRNNTKNTNYVTGALNGSTGLTSGSGWSAKNIGNGFWECTYTTPSLDAGDSIQAYFGATDTTVSTFAVVIEGIQVELGTVATPLQKTTTLLNVTEDGVASTYSLYFDGVDDYLIVAKDNLKFLHDGTGATGFIGFKPSGDMVYHTLLNTGNLGSATTVGYALAQDDRVGSGNILNTVTNGSGTSLVSNAYKTGTSANPRVVSFKNKIGTHALRMNGTEGFNTSTEIGTPNTAASTNDLWIGRAPAGYPFNGNLYSLIIMGRLASDTETTTLEKAIAKQVGVTL